MLLHVLIPGRVGIVQGGTAQLWEKAAFCGAGVVGTPHYLPNSRDFLLQAVCRPLSCCMELLSLSQGFISGSKASPSLCHLPLVCHGAPAGAFKDKLLQPRGLLTILCSKIKKVQELHLLFNQEAGAGIKEQNSEESSLIWRLQG